MNKKLFGFIFIFVLIFAQFGIINNSFSFINTTEAIGTESLTATKITATSLSLVFTSDSIRAPYTIDIINVDTANSANNKSIVLNANQIDDNGLATINITSLTANTSYYARLSNSSGQINQISFKTLTQTVQSSSITSFSPKEGVVGDSVVITGVNFTNVDKVYFGAVEVPSSDFHVDSITQITAKVPVNAVNAPITIINSQFGGPTSVDTFKIVSPYDSTKIASVTSYSPVSGKVGDEITIIGNNLILLDTDGISFGGVKASPKTNENNSTTGLTKMTVLVPSGATTGKITISTRYGSVIVGDFTVSGSVASGSDGDNGGTDGTNDITNSNSGEVTFSGLVPDCNTGPIDEATGKYVNQCDFSDFMAFINKLIKFLLFDIALPFVAIIIMYTGYLFLTAGGSAGQTEKAKHVLMNVVSGYIIALVAWLVISAILGMFDVTDPLIGSFLSK
jgi:hypothetical protein